MKSLLLLPLLALACVSSTAVSRVPTVTQAATLTPLAEGEVCALVIASESLNVRDEDHNVIGHLAHGEVVIVEDMTGDWWTVGEGVVRSRYLEIVPCP